MYHKFHMNPLFYILTIPISAFILYNPIMFIDRFRDLIDKRNLIIYYLINLLIVLIILFILYLTNIIGLFDLLIFLAIIIILTSLLPINSGNDNDNDGN